MRLRNLFYLLLALPLLLASCSKEVESDNHVEYFMEEALIFGGRAGNPSKDANMFTLFFSSTSNTIALSISIVGAEGDEVLKAGRYTDADNTLLINSASLADMNTYEFFSFEGGNGTAIVEGDENNYKIDFVLSDAQNRKYHFTYDGKISGISPDGDLPAEPQNIVAEHIFGYAMELSNFNYFITLSDKGYNEYGLRKANGNYYIVNIFGIEGEIDADGNMIIPAGTYTLDKSNSKAKNTIQWSESGYTKINEDGTEIYVSASYEEAQLVVTEDGMTLTAIIGDVEHTVTYNGTPKIKPLI